MKGLKAKGVFGVTTGLKAEFDTEAEIEKWGKKHAIAMFTISAKMEMKQIYLIESCS